MVRSTGGWASVGALVCCFGVRLSHAVLPFALFLSRGTMLCFISDAMVPEAHARCGQRGATYALLAGFCLMLLMDLYI